MRLRKKVLLPVYTIVSLALNSGCLEEPLPKNNFNLQPIGAVDFTNWTVFENNGFTYSIVDDTLNLDGNTVGGFQDYILRNEILPDSLEEFTIEYTFTISDALTSNEDRGTGPIMLNDLSSEDNYAVYTLFVTNPASSNFGRLQIYSGNGAVSPTAIVFRNQTSGTFAPAEDSVYTISLKRTIEGSDAFYTATLTNYVGDTLTTSFTEAGAPSSQYIGTTTKVGIWQNGGPFKISSFSIRREGSETVPPPPAPGPVQYEVFVEKTGDDANDCTQAEPCLTVNRAAVRVNELGPGAEPDVWIGPGTYVETSQVVWPAFLDTLDGAGTSSTVIKGAPDLYTQISTSGSGSPFTNDGFLFLLSSSISTDVSTVVRSLSMEGNRNVGGNNASMKGGAKVLLRDGIQFINVDVRYFNTTGIWLSDVDGAVIDGCRLQENGFSNPIPDITYSLGNLQLSGRATNIEVKNSLIDSPVFNQGEGIQYTSGPNAGRIDVHYHNNEFIVGSSSDAEDHHFAIEMLYWFMESGDSVHIHDNIFRKNISFGQRAASGGVVYIHHNQFLISPNKNLAIEAQFDNAEISYNYFSGVVGRVIGIYNGEGQSPSAPLFSAGFSNHHYHHNIADIAGNSEGFNDAVFGWNYPMHNLTVENNTINFMSASGAAWFVFQFPNTETCTDITIQNNAFHGALSSGSSTFDAVGPVTGGIIRNNKATHLNLNASRAGFTNSNNTVTGPGNTLNFLFTGAKYPVETGMFYSWPNGGALDDTGFGGADIGAWTDD